jgi:hypothetical protein
MRPAIAQLRRVLVRTRHAEFHMVAAVPRHGFTVTHLLFSLLRMTTILPCCNRMSTRFGYGSKRPASERTFATRRPTASIRLRFPRVHRQKPRNAGNG